MKASPQESVIINRIARLVRATRKQLGLSQETVAKQLGLIQSALSRIETGSQMLSAPQWAEFCALTGISPDSIMTGYVDLKRSAVLKQDDREGTFRIPKKYAKNRGSKVRALVPFLSFFEKTYGDENLKKYLRAQKIDPDFFIGLDNQISLKFCLDITEHLVKEGALRPNELDKLTSAVLRPETHGILHYQYLGKTSASDLLGLIIPNAPYYECNFKYSIENQNKQSFDFSISPEEHLESTNYRNHPVLGDFLCRYKKQYFSQFTSFGGQRNAPVEELECHYRGHDKCVYRVNL